MPDPSPVALEISQPLAHLSDQLQLLLLNLVGFLNLSVTFRPVEVMHCLS
ncbi:hypothetical protein M4M87_004669 [Escherichia coli]|nr:hypothetical protein [Escherichia coli]